MVKFTSGLQGPKYVLWAFGIVTLEVEDIKLLSTLPDLSEDHFVVVWLRVEEQEVAIVTTTVNKLGVVISHQLRLPDPHP